MQAGQARDDNSAKKPSGVLVIATDTIHPNDWGQVVFALVVADAIATCP